MVNHLCSIFSVPHREADPSLMFLQFGPGGHAYVYMCYGIHMMLNVVADKEGVGAAVLIRSCAPVSGEKPRPLSLPASIYI